MFEFNLTGLLAIFASLMCWSLAWLLFRVGAPGAAARRLSVLLLVEGVS